jgi:glutaminyl-peptide cyclotransferase
MTRFLVASALLMSLFVSRRPGFAAWQSGASVPTFGYTIVHTYPHDRDAFTQGLQVVDGVFYEGTGRNGHSSIRKVKIDTGEVLQKRDVPEQYFGEGVTVRGNELFQLTWQSGVAFVYDKATFAPKRQYKYQGEGWGLTQDRTSLLMSDGTEYIRVLDPATFSQRKRIRVMAAGSPLKSLNELELVRGELLANIWPTDYVARIDPATGVVNGYIDFRGLLSPREREATDVLNGIAYDEPTDRLFITGKLWPRVYEVRITRK